MQTVIRWAPDAVRDVDRLFQFLKNNNPVAARNAAVAVRQAANQLAEMPRLGKVIDAPDVLFKDMPPRREWPINFGKRGYVLRYVLEEEDVVILRVWHGLEDRS